MTQKIDWKDLGFEYRPTDSFVVAEYANGEWGSLQVRTDPYLKLHIGATCLHYGQACFEGLKAFTQKNGDVAIFRPGSNAQRMIRSAQRLVMQAPPEELFIEACKMVIANNREFVPPYGTGASLYIRPLLIGSTARVGVKPSDEFQFIVLATPVGPYYKDGFVPVHAFVQQDYDRAAPKGVGNIKAAGNYAAGLKGDLDAKKKGYPIALYLDAAQHEFIDEFGTSNFIGITKDNRYITPASSSILPSITNDSLQGLARDMGMTVERRQIRITELADLQEVGACGTAAVITPVASVTLGERKYEFCTGNKAGEMLTKLYAMLQQLQYGEIADTHGWMVKV